MSFEIEIGAIRDAHQLVPLPLLLFAFGKEPILNIDGALRVMREFFLRLFVKPKVLLRDAYALKPLITGVDPFLVRGFIFAGLNEIFHLHLLELARAKDEIAGRHFVAKRLADLRDAERELAAAGV